MQSPTFAPESFSGNEMLNRVNNEYDSQKEGKQNGNESHYMLMRNQ
jgi:hypothetical protein